MGTDIHCRVQHRHSYTHRDFFTGAEKTEHYWRTIDPPAWWPRDKWETKWIAEEEAKYAATQSVDALRTLVRRRSEWIIGRSYSLFAILANVRNGYGFAGVETGTAWPSIAPERGLPDGVDVDDKDAPWLGDHSHTWMTVAELLAFDWHGTTQTHYGVVPLDTYQPGVRPSTWSGMVSGRDIVTVEESAVDGLTVPVGTRVYVRQAWQWTAAEACQWFVDDYLPAFRRLCDELGATPGDVRLVLGFDS